MTLTCRHTSAKHLISLAKLLIHYLPLVPAAVGADGKLWATFLPLKQQVLGLRPRGVTILARDFQVVTLYDADGTFAGAHRIGSSNSIEIEGMKIHVDGAVGATGLQLKADPGVPLVYAGFGGEQPCPKWLLAYWLK